MLKVHIMHCQVSFLEKLCVSACVLKQQASSQPCLMATSKPLLVDCLSSQDLMWPVRRVPSPNVVPRSKILQVGETTYIRTLSIEERSNKSHTHIIRLGHVVLIPPLLFNDCVSPANDSETYKCKTMPMDVTALHFQLIALYSSNAYSTEHCIGRNAIDSLVVAFVRCCGLD